MKAHHNFRYLIDKVRLGIWTKKNPDNPWLTQESVAFLDQYLNKQDCILETGSGRSTIWFAKRVGKVYSIEHHEDWFKQISKTLKKERINNVEYFLEPREYKESPANSPYVTRLGSFDNEMFDMILVDGKHRGFIALNGLEKIKKGGIIVIDNVEREIIIDTISPARITEKKQVSKEWQKFQKITKDFRKVVFGNGVSDTMIVFIPKI